jgi:hypothetical protein
MRDVATQSRMLQRLTSNSLRMQLPDLTVDVILARTSSLSLKLNLRFMVTGLHLGFWPGLTPEASPGGCLLASNRWFALQADTLAEPGPELF